MTRQTAHHVADDCAGRARQPRAGPRSPGSPQRPAQALGFATIQRHLDPLTLQARRLPILRVTATCLVLDADGVEAWFNRVTGRGMAGAKGGPRVPGQRAERRAADWTDWIMRPKDRFRWEVEDPAESRETEAAA